MLDLLTGDILPSGACEEMWERTCQEILDNYVENDLNQLLCVLHTENFAKVVGLEK